ncbi:hypothetical protein HDV01_001115 [Terramyces sp. JEL0728]|nr:hypothetical protein HDV01_001115 [Terramyces sp. JEL0728]
MDVFLLSEPPLFDDSQFTPDDNNFSWPETVPDKEEQPKPASPLKEDFHFFEDYSEMQVDNCPLKRCGDYGCLDLKRARTDSGFDDLTNLFILCMIPTAAFFTVTDVEAMNADRRFAQQFSVSKSDELQQVKTSMTAEDWKKKFWENKNSIVGYTWLGLMSASLVYNFRQKNINFTQKLINSRLIAQSGALLGIAALGIMAINMPKEESVVVDKYYERIVNPESDAKQ